MTKQQTFIHNMNKLDLYNMNLKQLFPFVILILLLSCASQKPKKRDADGLEIMFYNLENFFDTIDDPKTMDEEYLPKADKRWNTDKYNTKLKNISKVISEIDGGSFPDLIGLCEFEHRSILEDLKKNLNLTEFKISHFESPDHRGIDVGLMYNDSIFELINEEPIYVQLNSPERVFKKMDKSKALETIRKNGSGNTRNILKTMLKLGTDTICVFTCHFPSRRGGKNETSYKRELVANILKHEIKQETKKNPRMRVIVMGDFNDEPTDISINQILGAKKVEDKSSDLYNLFYTLDQEREGSYKYRLEMNMLDQIIISSNLWNKETTSRIFNPSWLIQIGKYAGFPLRTFGGKNYLAGYSDHFPVFAHIPLK